MRFIDLTGQRFGRLLVLKRDANDSAGSVCWQCMCDCETLFVTRSNSLQSGRTQSCGCLRQELIAQLNKTHAATNSREYRAWQDMKTRCYNSNRPMYVYYGGRGISVCARWQRSFAAFLLDMGPCPDGYTLERRENADNYEPDNCRWATSMEQANNTRRNVFLEFDGKRQTVAQWARELGMSPYTLYDRLRRNWELRDVLSTTKHTGKRYEATGGLEKESIV
jgi:hypothetical protein